MSGRYFGRRIVGCNKTTGEVRTWRSASEFADEFGVKPSSVTVTTDRMGTVCGWALYDTPERLRYRIADLEEILRKVETMLEQAENK